MRSLFWPLDAHWWRTETSVAAKISALIVFFFKSGLSWHTIPSLPPAHPSYCGNNENLSKLLPQYQPSLALLRSALHSTLHWKQGASLPKRCSGSWLDFDFLISTAHMLPQEGNEPQDWEVVVISWRFCCKSCRFCVGDFMLLTLVLLCSQLMR